MTDLIRQIDALLDLDARGALVPHGIGGLARELLTKSRAALASPTPGGVVKQLEWEQHVRGGDEDEKRFWRARTPMGGFYWIEMHHSTDGFDGVCIYNNTRYVDVPAAKAVCQIEHERRILSALDPASSPPATEAPEGWRTMESAPKDGAEVLLWDGQAISLAAWEMDIDTRHEKKPRYAWMRPYTYQDEQGGYSEVDKPILWLNPTAIHPAPPSSPHPGENAP